MGNSSVDSFPERIAFVIDKLGGPGKAAKSIGTTYTTLNRWRSGEADPSRLNLIKIADAAKVELNWLITGSKSEESNEKDNFIESPNSKTLDFIQIPAYDIEVSAGQGMFTEGVYEADKQLSFRKRWITARGLDAKKLAVLFTKGDSMTPTIPENAAIVIDMERNQAMDGKVYVIRADDRLYVKRVQWIPGGGLRLISDNKQYDTFDITKDDMAAANIEICGQVIHAAYDLPD